MGCVEVEASSPLPGVVAFKCDGDICQVKVDYQGLPPICSICQAFGHDTKRCKKQPKTVKKTVENSEWTTVGKGKGIATETGAPSSSNLPEQQIEDPVAEEASPDPTGVEEGTENQQSYLHPTGVEKGSENLLSVLYVQSKLPAEIEDPAHNEAKGGYLSQPRSPVTRSRSGTFLTPMEGEGIQEESFTPTEDKEPDPPPKGPNRPAKSSRKKNKKRSAHSG
ncbi:hypothetical protein U1Q18_013475 [Sarracenia purpurea var. burkii]